MWQIATNGVWGANRIPSLGVEYGLGIFAMTRTDKGHRTWIVIDGKEVVYRGKSCVAALVCMDERRLKSSALFVSSNVAKLLRDSGRKAS